MALCPNQLKSPVKMFHQHQAWTKTQTKFQTAQTPYSQRLEFSEPQEDIFWQPLHLVSLQFQPLEGRQVVKTAHLQHRNLVVIEKSATKIIHVNHVHIAIWSHFDGYVHGDQTAAYKYRADTRLVPSQWEISLLSHSISHWLGTSTVESESH